MLEIDPQEATTKIIAFIRARLDEFQRDGAILGMSGGIDSSVCAHLLERAVGPERVQALLMPERDSSPESRVDALVDIEKLGIQFKEVPLTPMLEAIGIYQQVPLRFLGTRRIKEAVVRRQHDQQAGSLGEQPFLAGLLGTRELGRNQELIDSGNAYARIKHRMRMVVLYYYAELQNLMVIGTTNRSEAMTGFTVKWGDNVADIELILPLYKTQVRQLAEYLGVDQRIIDKAPSPDLMPGIVDEYALGIDYVTLDRILWGIDRQMDTAQIVEQYQVDEGQVAHVRELVRRSEHLRHLPPAPEL